MVKFTTNSPEETIFLGERIAGVLPHQAVIAVSGKLGSGKTTFVKGIASGLGIDPKTVNSPSYVLIKEYSYKGRNLFHCDLYRLQNMKDIASLGIEDYFIRKGLFIIEWAEKAQGLLPGEYLRIDIQTLALDKRRFNFEETGPGYKKITQRIRQLSQKHQARQKE